MCTAEHCSRKHDQNSKHVEALVQKYAKINKNYVASWLVSLYKVEIPKTKDRK